MSVSRFSCPEQRKKVVQGLFASKFSGLLDIFYKMVFYEMPLPGAREFLDHVDICRHLE